MQNTMCRLQKDITKIMNCPEQLQQNRVEIVNYCVKYYRNAEHKKI